MPTIDEIMQLPPDQHGIVDISQCGQPRYTSKAFRFGDFAIYVEDCLFKTPTGQFSSYTTVRTKLDDLLFFLYSALKVAFSFFFLNSSR
jgi:hypothetical protein